MCVGVCLLYCCFFLCNKLELRWLYLAHTSPLKSDGNNIPPCLTPLVTKKCAEQELPHLDGNTSIQICLQ